MKDMKQLVKNLVNEDSGQDLIEYALVAALVGLGAVAAMKGLDWHCLQWRWHVAHQRLSRQRLNVGIRTSDAPISHLSN